MLDGRRTFAFDEAACEPEDDRAATAGSREDAVAPMTVSLRYASRREEVWRWYWRSWRRTLWNIHLRIGLVAFALAFLVIDAGRAPTPFSLAAATLVALGLIGFLVLYPQLRFKPELRTLTADEEGLKTAIGRRRGAIPWSKIARIAEDHGYVIVESRSGNAFIIPPRAFESERVKADLLSLARQAAPGLFIAPPPPPP
jgi:membrane protein YdbS with pleckstrin-like domain